MSLFDPAMPKKECQIQRSCVATASSITVQPPLWPLYILCHANGQFFHLQCMQSMLPSIPGNPLLSLTARIRAVSLAVGDLKYCFSNTAITALQNLYKQSMAGLGHAEIVIGTVTRRSICKQPHC